MLLKILSYIGVFTLGQLSTFFVLAFFSANKDDDYVSRKNFDENDK